MDALESELQDQVTQVQAALQRARAEQDDYLVHIHQGELEGLTRTADAHGLRLELEPHVVDLTAVERDSARIA